MMLCHILSEHDWKIARDTGRHAPPALERDGFLHCCTESQLAFVLGRHFRHATGLLVLRFDPATVPAALRWEKSEPDQDPFPHLYGPLPAAAIASASPVSAPA